MKPPVFCRLFYAANNIPIVCYEGESLLCAFGFPANVPVNGQPRFTLLRQGLSPAMTVDETSGFYGLIRDQVKDKIVYIIGPVFSTTVTAEIYHRFLHANALNPSDEIQRFLNLLPRQSYNQFLSLLAYLHYILNGQEIDIIEHFSLPSRKIQENMAASQIQAAYDTRDEQNYHGSYAVEMQMIDLVREGDGKRLRNLMAQISSENTFHEGTVGNTPLRQAKNIFLAQVALVGKMGAIPGGLDPEETYHLIDTYSQECERLQKTEDIISLQYNMLMDFTERVAKTKIPEGISSEVFACICFINEHLNEPISIEEISEHIHRSRSYTMKAFKEELGFNIGEYIAHARIHEAQSLLRFTDKPLSEISSYLCYSSQSYA